MVNIFADYCSTETLSLKFPFWTISSRILVCLTPSLFQTIRRLKSIMFTLNRHMFEPWDEWNQQECRRLLRVFYCEEKVREALETYNDISRGQLEDSESIQLFALWKTPSGPGWWEIEARIYPSLYQWPVHKGYEDTMTVLSLPRQFQERCNGNASILLLFSRLLVQDFQMALPYQVCIVMNKPGFVTSRLF